MQGAQLVWSRIEVPTALAEDPFVGPRSLNLANEQVVGILVMGFWKQTAHQPAYAALNQWHLVAWGSKGLHTQLIQFVWHLMGTVGTYSDRQIGLSHTGQL